MAINYPEWAGDEPCKEIGTAPFYEDDRSDMVKLIPFLTQLCYGCPSLDMCRDYARKHEWYGFWGGETQTQRRRWRTENNVVLARPEAQWYGV
jgi:hypothetical protein